MSEHKITPASYPALRVLASESFALADAPEWDGLATRVPAAGPAIGIGDLVPGSIVIYEWRVRYTLEKADPGDVLGFNINVAIGAPSDLDNAVGLASTSVKYVADALMTVRMEICLGEDVDGNPALNGLLTVNAPVSVDEDTLLPVYGETQDTLPLNIMLLDGIADPIACFLTIEEAAIEGAFVTTGQALQLLSYKCVASLGEGAQRFGRRHPFIPLITATQAENGTVTPEGVLEVPYVLAEDELNYEPDDATYTITPADNFTLDELLVDGEDDIGNATEEAGVWTYVFEDVAVNHTIEPVFVEV